MAAYGNKSFEELRFEDYKKGNKGGSTSVGLGAFGAGNSTAKPLFASSTPAFGAATAGTTAASPFGTSAFGPGTTASSPFGATPTSFGLGAAPQAAAQQPFGGSFGSSSAAAQPSFAFGATSTSNMFGSPSPSPAAATPAFGFGQQQQSQPQTQQNAFGTTFGVAAPTGFGTTTPSMFGSTTSGQPAFGVSPTAGGMFSGKSLGGGFGTTQAPAFGQTFSAQPTANSSGFGTQFSPFGSTIGNTQQSNQFKMGSTSSMFPTTSNAATPQQQSFGGFTNFGAVTQSPWGQQPGLQQQQQQQPSQQQQQQPPQQQQQQLDISQKMDFLKKKKDELISSQSSSIATTTISTANTNVNEESKSNTSFAFTGFSGDVNFLGVPISHRSAARVIPRGMRPLSRSKTTSSATNTSVVNMAGDTRNSIEWPSMSSKLSVSSTLESLSSPDLMYLGRNAKKLIIAPSPTGRGDSSHSSTQRGDITEGLPARNVQPIFSVVSSLTDTPAKPDNGYTADSQNNPKSTLTPGGDATGLTPAGPISTPSADEKTSNGEEGGTMRLVFQASPPTLTLDGYCAIPDIEDLNRMSNSELSKVKDFTVRREKFGMIKWEGLTDVRGLNLDKLIRIDKKEVFVYEGFDQPPPVGQELNKDAVITLWNVFPKGNKPDDHSKFESKLRKFCAINDAEYKSYSPASGEWVFAVKHFSRYGLDDSDEDEGDPCDSNLPSQETKVNQTDKFREQYLPPPNKSSLDMDIDSFSSEGVERLRSILQGYASRATAFRSPPHSEHDLSEETFRSPTHSVSEKKDIRRSLYTTISPKFFGSSESFNLAHVPSIDLEQLQNSTYPPPASTSFCMEALSKAKADIAMQVGPGHQPQSIELHTTARLTKSVVSCRIKNFSLAMGRSFRAGWSANGRLIFPGAKLATYAEDNNNSSTDRTSNPVVVYKVDSLKWIRTVPCSQSSKSILELFEPALQAVLLFSHIEQVNPLDSKHKSTLPTVPLWRTPRY